MNKSLMQEMLAAFKYLLNTPMEKGGRMLFFATKQYNLIKEALFFLKTFDISKKDVVKAIIFLISFLVNFTFKVAVNGFGCYI